MVLADLGRRLNTAINSLSSANVVDEKALDAVLKEVCAALLESDVNVKLVAALRTKVRSEVRPLLNPPAPQPAPSPSKAFQIVQKAIFDQLVLLVDPNRKEGEEEKEEDKGGFQWLPKKGKSNVLMAVGIQGAGKTTTCTKLAAHYSRRGFKTSLVCADTFRAGAFDQLKQNATKAKIPYFGSYTETDPVEIARQGVVKFKKERFDVIIVDTSGRHRQEAELFEEMVAIGDAVKPDLTIMVLDASIGQAAESQSKAFKESAGFGAIIVTKLDGHAKGGGAISAVAATKTPIIFLGTGEHLQDLERFSPRPFVSKLLGMGDMQGLLEHIQDIQTINPEKQKDLATKFRSGKLSIKDWREQMQTVMGMGSLSKIASMIPGLPAGLLDGNEEEAGNKLKKLVFVTDAMTARELDSDGSCFIRKDKDGNPIGFTKRVVKIAQGSGTSVREVEDVLMQHHMMSSIAKQAGGAAKANPNAALAAKLTAAMGGPPLGPGGQPSQQQMQAIQRAMPPELLRKMRAAGPAGAQKMMNEIMNGGPPAPGAGPPGGGMPGFGDLMKTMGGMFGGGGAGGGGLPGMGAGGMPSMADMQKAMQMMGGGAGGGGMPDMSALMKMMGGMGGAK
ncbi:signal recognition particle protein [Phaffia rhodozyma]|uniref:signal-recognition-particle GTPase n=1 Tax=Phaffia rhodozyma TaxID=264483 RepID=A0A0F7SS59_PHARH|nr:signal recognition particle protein [Phaffia rhodozyma]